MTSARDLAEKLADQFGIVPKPAPAVSGMEKTMTEHIEQFFAYAHLKPEMQVVSKPFGELATRIVAELPRNPERTVALRKLLEAKDAAVRAFIAKDAS